MYVTDLRRDFYSVLRHQRVLLLANMDVDAVCAVKILLALFQSDQISYTLVPVSGRSHLIRAFRENVADASGGQRVVVLVNCGATVDLVQDLGLDDDEDEAARGTDKLVVFVADSHRPVDVCNVHNDGQIRLLMKQEEDEGVPDYDDVFKDTDSENEDSDSEKENGEKRSRFDESTILKRRERRIWEEKRSKILFEYSQYSYYGPSTAMQMYELAWKMSRDTNDLLWYAIVGLTEQFITLKSDDERHLTATGYIREHVSRLNNKVDTESMAVNCMKLNFDKELSLTLYRHWSVYESLLHTIYTASKFKVWSLKGKQRLSEFLAELGMPLAQCKQKYSTMDLGLRTEICQMFESKADKYGLENITQGSFSANFGYRNKFCASDVVYAVSAQMEPVCTDPSETTDAFLRALDCLSRSKITLLEDGIKNAREELTIVMQQVQNFFDLHSVVSAGPFLYAVIRDGAPNAKYFGRPTWLAFLAQYALRAYAAMSGKKVQALPLVVSAPLDEVEGICLVVGVPPVNDRSRKNLLGKAFEQALKRTNCRFRLDYFDSSIIQLRTEDRAKFFDGLISLLS